ncbi:MAG: hypothetical protein ACYTBX_02970 [Planctomycetota bacterium]
MTHRMKKATIRRLLAKGLTGWEAGKLVVQDSVDAMCEKPRFLSDSDVCEIERGLTTNKDIRDYNKLLGIARHIDRGLMVCQISSLDACLYIGLLSRMFSDVDKKNTVEFFMSFLPRLVTEKQYQDIVEEQRKVKLTFDFCLEYIAAERAVLKAPDDIEYVPDADNIKEQCPETYQQTLKEIFKLYKEGKLKASWQEEDEDKVLGLLAKEKKGNLNYEELGQLLDKLNVTGQQLYKCKELPEWKELVDNFQRHWFADEDDRFSDSYAVVQNPWYENVDEKGYYKKTFSPSEFITKRDEITLGLATIDGEKTKSCKAVSQDLQAMLKRVQMNIRCFLALKAIIDIASEVTGITFSDQAGGLESANEQVELYIQQYNNDLERLKKEHRWGNAEETKLEKVLKSLSPIEPDKLKPSAASLEQLKKDILPDCVDGAWLRDMMLLLNYDDGFTFSKLLGKG